jgi:hypothetical protein
MTTTAYTPALYTGNNTTPTYSFSFKIFDDADLRVVQTDTNAVETVLVLNTDYTVTGAGTATGGSITLTAGNLATGYKLKIGLGLAITQPTSIRNQSAYYASVHEDVFDRLTKIDQQQQGQLDRVPMIREGLTGVDMALPDPVAGAALGWNADGVSLGNLLGDSAGTLEDAKALTLADLASTASGKGDELVGVKRTATGAVPTTQHMVNENRAFNAVSDFGCPTDGTSDCTAAIHAAILGVPSGSTIEFPAGTFKMNITLDKFVHLKGAGQTATIFKPFATPGCIIQQTYYPGIGIMQLTKIQDIQFNGAATGVVDTGVRCGHASYTTNDENTGKLHFDHCSFFYFDKCVSRPYGNIYVVFTNCEFSVANYHVWSTSNASPIMHCGCLFFDKCHLEYANLASVYIDSSVQGTGQVISTGSIFENNPGFIWFVKNFNNTGDVGFNITDTWQEANYTAASVTIDAVAYTPPKYAYFTNANLVNFNGSPVGPMTLTNSVVLGGKFNADFMTAGSGAVGAAAPVLDADSSFLLSDTQTNGAVNPTYTRSFIRAEVGANSAARVPHRSWLSAGGHNATAIAVQPCTALIGGAMAPITQTLVATDGVLFRPCIELTITAATNNYDDTPGAYITTTAGKWYVFLVTYKLVSGTMPTVVWGGGVPFGAVMPSVLGGLWVTMATIAKEVSPIARQLNFIGSANATLRIGGYCMLEFATRQEALIFLDSGAFPMPTSPQTVANGAVATTLGSVGPTGANAGNPLGWTRIYVAGTARYQPYW